MSLFTQVLDVRDKFKEVANTNYDLLSNIMTNTLFPAGKEYCQALNDEVLMTLYLDQQAATNMIRFTNNVSGTVIIDVPTADLGKYAETTVDELNGLSVNDYIDEASSAANLYNTLSNISGKYAYLSKQKYTDIVNMFKDASIKGKAGIISALGQAADMDGYISVSGFFGVIKNYFEIANKATNNGSLELDQTNPYKFVSIFAVIAEVAEAIFNVLVLVLNGLFRVIMGILSIVFKLFTTVFTNLQNKEKASFDATAGNLYMLGPVLAWDSTISTYEPAHCQFYNLVESAPVNYWPSENFELRNIFLQEENGVASFVWMIDPLSETSGSRNNVYFYPYFDVTRIDYTQIFTGNTSGYSIISMNSNVQNPNHPYYISISSNFESWPHYDDEHVPQTANEMVFSIAFGLFIRHLSLVKQAVDIGSPTYGIWDVQWLMNMDTLTAERDANTTPSDGNYYFLYKLLSKLGALYKYGNWNNAVISSKNWEYGMDLLADRLAQYMSKFVMPNNANPSYKFDEVYNPNWLVFSHPSGTTKMPPMAYPLCGTSMCRYVTDLFGQVQLQYTPVTWGDHLVPNFRASDCLPCSFGFCLPTISGEELRTLLAIIGITVTVVAISAAAISVAVSKANITKRALKAEKIKDARKAYLANPKDPDAKAEYQNLVWKYNLFGKVFGYGSYDGKNDWFDSASSDSSLNFEKFDDLSARFVETDSQLSDSDQVLLDIRDHLYVAE